MAIEHPGACIFHHRADPFSHGGLVTMDRTPGALRLPLLVWAAGEPLSGICQELTAIRAEIVRAVVPGAALHSNHRFNGLILSD